MKTFKPLTLFLTLTLALFLAACAQGQPQAAPPDIRYGETICEQCNMIISDERFAAGYAHEISPGRYESIAFDDIGDMLESAADHPERNITHWYVHDFNTKEWLDATQAYYMFSDELTTPMGHGTAAFADKAAAEAMAAEMAGEVLDWSGLRQRFEAGELTVHAHAPTADASDQMTHDDAHDHEQVSPGTDTIETDGAARITIIAPADGATVPQMVTVQVATEHFDPMTPGNHWHVFVDGELAQMVGSSDTVTLHDLAEGEHTISVSMSNAQHEDLPGSDEITIMVGEGMASAHDHDSMQQHMHGDDSMPMHMEETILGEAEVEGYQLQLVSHAPLHTGYNVVMAHLNDPEGKPVTDAAITFSPLMDMKEGMDHAAGVEQPEMEMPGMYHGAIAFPMPSGPDLGNWTLTVSFTDPATGISGETSFDITVLPSKLSGSFVAPDESRIFLMVIDPLVPTVGAQPFEIFAMQRAGATDWPTVDDLELAITPWMPTMDHGSSGNQNPVSTGDGHYLGQVNFSMAGPWTVTVVASRAGETLGEVVFEYTIR